MLGIREASGVSKFGAEASGLSVGFGRFDVF